MRRFNLLDDGWEREFDRPGYRSRTTSVSRPIGGERIGATLYELAPGERTWPYHLHHANEEWLLVVGGRPTLRTPDGERELRAGDTVCFPRGPRGAHQIANRSDSTARLLLLSTHVAPEVVEYLDSGKIGVAGEGLRLLLRRDAEVDYWEGE